ncbi:MAG: hypothetical protein GF401_04295 [Chitinivibrionales bacterium]|nr:hypothetical protein [Chitinivibrionales bacterium]
MIRYIPISTILLALIICVSSFFGGSYNGSDAFWGSVITLLINVAPFVLFAIMFYLHLQKASITKMLYVDLIFSGIAMCLVIIIYGAGGWGFVLAPLGMGALFIIYIVMIAIAHIMQKNNAGKNASVVDR